MHRVLRPVVIGAVLLVGCATVPSTPHDIQQGEPASPVARGWWAARYRLDWPEAQEPRMHLDLLLAHRVVSPVLAAHRKDIELCRFHRRAARDAAGHQFSFIVCTTPQTAQRLFNELRSSRELRALKASGLVVSEIYSDTRKNKQPHIGDTSDPHWSPVLKEQWPYFIMGVSELWLRLVAAFAEQGGELGSGQYFEESADAMEAHYRKVSAAVDEVWRDEGGHALLHHLSAVFGYQPLYIQEKRLLGF